jgi:hypothetical protein
MAYEQKDGDISIFKNNKKATEKQPDYTGTALINGQKMQVALWIKEGQKGKFFAGKIQEDTYRQSDNTKPISNGLAQQLDDDFSF